MDPNFVRADNSNLPKIDAFMVAHFFKNNADYYAAELKNVKTAIATTRVLTGAYRARPDDAGRRVCRCRVYAVHRELGMQMNRCGHSWRRRALRATAVAENRVLMLDDTPRERSIELRQLNVASDKSPAPAQARRALTLTGNGAVMWRCALGCTVSTAVAFAPRAPAAAHLCKPADAEVDRKRSFVRLEMRNETFHGRMRMHTPDFERRVGGPAVVVALRTGKTVFDVKHLYARWIKVKPRRLKIQETLGFGVRPLHLALRAHRGVTRWHEAIPSVSHFGDA
ncbi:hypothetical protein EVAR_79144_1 [Eumeta japonica]|uniref:Uncharacterized protein n=1 Tax=Eumeta variegata TaxID=151549 RepID=A0A4C1UT26_EUMVA|nr:hypothetical protein EVAR_79144_1 [Eumeta japonica]